MMLTFSLQNLIAYLQSFSFRSGMGQTSLQNCRKKSHAKLDTEFRRLRCLLADQVEGEVGKRY